MNNIEEQNHRVEQGKITMQEIKENNKYLFSNLAVKDDIDITVYDDALTYALNSKDVSNIAISGVYGSGKSSVVETYKRQNPQLKCLHVSLSTFSEEQKSKKENDLQTESHDLSNSNIQSDEKTNYRGRKLNITDKNNDQKTVKADNINEDKILEGKILNHIIHQISGHKIPQTNFNVKRKYSPFKLGLLSIIITLYLLSIFSILNYQAILEYIEDINILFKDTIISLITNNIVVFFNFIFFITISIYLIFTVIKYQKNKQILKRINFKGSEINLFSENNDSYFDKYLNDVLYVLESSKIDLLIFEDMDRFETNVIFAKLREINLLLQQRRKIRSNRMLVSYVSSKSTWFANHYAPQINFLYLLRDDVFENKDRTKFFDFIIPIVPVLDQSNSYDHFIKEFKERKISHNLDTKFLRKISLYIDDFRLLTNVINEYQIYKSKILTHSQNENKLFAIIIYKNIFPKDFSRLQLGQGYIHTILSKRKKLIDDLVLNNKIEISKIEKELESSATDIVSSRYELLSLYFLSPSHLYQIDGKQYETSSTGLPELIEYMDKSNSTIYAIGYRGNSSVFNFTDEITRIESLDDYKKRYKLNSRKFSNKTRELREELTNLKRKIELINTSLFTDLIDSKDEAVFMVISENEIGETESFLEIKRSPYFGLIKFLVREGYIDETYFDYMAKFLETSIKINDKIFIRSLMDRAVNPYSMVLENPALVYERLSDSDYDKPEIVNLSLAIYLISIRDEIGFRKIIKHISKENEYSFLRDLVEEVKEKEFVVQNILVEWEDVLFDIINYSNYDRENLVRVIQFFLIYVNEDELSQIVDSSEIRDELSTINEILETTNNHNTQLIRRKLTIIDIKFSDITTIENYDVLKFISTNSLYLPNVNNVCHLMQILSSAEYNSDDLIESNLSLLFECDNIEMIDYVKQNISEYLNSIISTHSSIANSSEDNLFIINNAKIELPLKEQYIKAIENKIENINEVLIDETKIVLLNNNKVACTLDNVLRTYKDNNNELNDHLVKFINENNISTISFNYKKIDKAFGDGFASTFWNSVISQYSLNSHKYIYILKSLGFVYNNKAIFPIVDLPIEHAEELFKTEIVKMNEKHLQHVRNHYDTVKTIFICTQIKGYIDLIESNQHLQDGPELKSVLSSEVDDRYKELLLNIITIPFDTRNIDCSIKINNVILRKHFNFDDFGYWVEMYDKLHYTTKKIIVGFILNRPTELVKIESISVDILNYVMKLESVDIDVKKSLIANNCRHLKQNQVKDLLSNSRMDDFLSLFDGKNPTFEDDEENQKLLQSLLSKRWIHKIKEDGDRLRGYGKKMK